MSSSDSRPDTRLASYGSLAPGRVNHDQVSMLSGHWQKGTVKGNLVQMGWGTALGFPGLMLDSQGPDVEVFVFESLELPGHWARLDEFEGSGYRRVVTQVTTPNGELNAYIYVVREEDSFDLPRRDAAGPPDGAI